jgi:ferredoxin
LIYYVYTKLIYKAAIPEIDADKNKCINCKVCNKNYVMSLPVSEMVQKSSMENPESVLCGGCVDSCQRGAIKYSFGVKMDKDSSLSQKLG